MFRGRLIELIDRLFVRFKRVEDRKRIKHVVFINWNGKYGDAIVSAPLIDHLRRHSDIEVSVITTQQLKKLYSSVIQVDSIYLIKNVSWLNILNIRTKVKGCDAIIPLFGKRGILDVLCIFLLNPRFVFSTDCSLKMSNKKFLKESKNKDVYELYELVAEIILGRYTALTGVKLCAKNEDNSISYDYLINPFASREDKSLSLDRTLSLITHLASFHSDKSFGIFYPPESLSFASQLMQLLDLPNVELINGTCGFEKVIPVIRNSGVLISVDTSLVHVSLVLNKKVVAIYPETVYFNIWQPSNSHNFQVVTSTGLIDFGAVKNMNQFENDSVNYALNRIKNGARLASKKIVFLYWHSSIENIPIGHALNIKNLESRLEGSDWDVVVTTLDKGSENYIENYISLPSYFNELIEKTGDETILHGNQSDIVRLRLLENYGGVYLDTSTIFLKNDFEEVALYRKLCDSTNASLAGYTNLTFTRKDKEGCNYFEEAKDGMELCILYAKEMSNVLKIFNREIDKYWNWKTPDKDYKDYPPFREYDLTSVSFLNEYHVHYSIYHLIITRQPDLLEEILVQSMHRKGKETALSHGPYALSDLFCRGETSCEPASPQKMLQCFIGGELDTWNGIRTSLEDRIEICKEIELLKIPAYLRRDLENEFKSIEDYINKSKLYHEIYDFLTPERQA